MPPRGSSKFTLRLAKEADLGPITRVERLSYPFPWTIEAFRNELAKPFSHVFVLIDESASSLHGYVVYWLLFDECHVLNVTVDPERRGLGLSKMLMQKVIDDALARGIVRVFLEVRVGNSVAVALYKGLGFFVDHVKASFYEDGEDALFMVRYLNNGV